VPRQAGQRERAQTRVHAEPAGKGPGLATGVVFGAYGAGTHPMTRTVASYYCGNAAPSIRCKQIMSYVTWLAIVVLMEADSLLFGQPSGMLAD
jgi:hypothetical protein